METVVAMTPDELGEAIVGPADLAGVTVEPGLVGAVVADATGQPGALPLVQYAVTELFDHHTSGTITLQSYRELGGVRGAIGRRAEALYESLDDAAKVDARGVLSQLVTLGEGEEDTRRRVARADLVGAKADVVVEAFGAARLLSFDHDPATRRPTVEVAHEALLREWPRLRDWIDESRDDIRTQRRLRAAADEWVVADRAPSYLLTGQRLRTFDEWRKTGGPTLATLATLEAEFLDASVEAEQSARRKRATTRRRIAVALSTAAIVAAALAVLAFVRGAQVAREARIAEVRELAGASIAALDTDPELGLLLALEAVERNPLPGSAGSPTSGHRCSACGTQVAGRRSGRHLRRRVTDSGPQSGRNDIGVRCLWIIDYDIRATWLARYGACSW